MSPQYIVRFCFSMRWEQQRRQHNPADVVQFACRLRVNQRREHGVLVVIAGLHPSLTTLLESGWLNVLSVTHPAVSCHGGTDRIHVETLRAD